MRFIALDHSLRVIERLRPLVRSLRAHDRSLATQICNAGSSIALNLGEGSRRHGADRRHHYRIASGSAEEVRTALRVAEAWGYSDAQRSATALDDVDELQAMLWKLTR